jgi:hypothetical protein
MEAFLTDIPAMDQSIHLSKEPKKTASPEQRFSHSQDPLRTLGRYRLDGLIVTDYCSPTGVNARCN